MEYVRNTGDERLVLVTGRLHAGTAGGMQGSGQDSAVEQAMMAAKPAGQSSCMYNSLYIYSTNSCSSQR